MKCSKQYLDEDILICYGHALQCHEHVLQWYVWSEACGCRRCIEEELGPYWYNGETFSDQGVQRFTPYSLLPHGTGTFRFNIPTGACIPLDSPRCSDSLCFICLVSKGRQRRNPGAKGFGAGWATCKRYPSPRRCKSKSLDTHALYLLRLMLFVFFDLCSQIPSLLSCRYILERAAISR